MAAVYSRNVKESTAKRLTDLTTFGDSITYMLGFATLGALVGGVVGWPFNRPGEVAAAGVLFGMFTWVVLVVIAHRQLRPYLGTHREIEDVPSTAADDVLLLSP